MEEKDKYPLATLNESFHGKNKLGSSLKQLFYKKVLHIL